MDNRDAAIRQFFEPSEVSVSEPARRISVRWTKISKTRRWISNIF